MSEVSKKYKPTIGLEIHAELRTKTKMFCNSKNDPDEKRPNVNICPVCMAYPGTLPVINREAVKHVLKIGLAVGGTLADYTEFDRKNYFYPDIPKGYQISQYKFPLVTGGSLAGVELERIHLEEDTARSSHDEGEYSLVDFNRAGVPLMELVTKPVIHDAETAVRFAKELQLLLQYVGAGEANMEKGEMRVEANISVSVTDAFGTKVEVKNLNSFRAAERAITYEIERHIVALEAGEKLTQETRGWDDAKQRTFSQRSKEQSHDYRYFPDPDLPSLRLSQVPDFNVEVLQSELPELPWQKRQRMFTVFGLKAEDADVFVNTPRLGAFFEQVTTLLQGGKGDERNERKQNLIVLASNYIISDLLGLMKKNQTDKNDKTDKDTDMGKVTPKTIADIVILIDQKKINSRGAKDLLASIFVEGGEVEEQAEKKSLLQTKNEGAIRDMVKKVVSENASVVAEYKKGKSASLQFLIGQTMKISKGSANPETIKKLLLEVLGTQ